MGWDLLSWVIALLVFVVIRYDLRLTASQWSWAILYTGVAMTLQAALGLLTHVYLGRSRVGSFSEATWVGALVLLTGIPLGLTLSVLTPDFPRGVALMAPPLALTFMAAGRWLFRILLASRLPRTVATDAVPALVYGAGEAGHQVAMLVDKAEQPPYRIVGFVDDDPAKRFLRVRAYRVNGTGKDLVDVARERGADMVILAISAASPELIQDVSQRCEAAGLQLVILPPVREMIGGQISLSSLREFKVEDLLGRRPVKTDLSAIAHYVTGQRVLVTGAGGSIGSEIARQLQKLGPAKLILLDRDESALHGVQLDLYGNGLLDTDDMVLCDIRDDGALCAVFQHQRPDVVFHAAALKHLPMLERYPDEGWKTNVLGTLNVLRCAHDAGVKHLVNISTDKAADASSVLGRTKRLAERLTAWFAERHHLRYLSVRFGNVLGSRGSVLHSFRAQIERGGPVTVTHPDVTRYFMTIPEACELVLQAGAIGRPGEVLVLDMGQPVRIVDVAERLIAESGQDIDIHFTGLRQGEKLHEVLLSDAEDRAPSTHPLISQVPVPALDPRELPSHERSAAVDEPTASMGRLISLA
ncbi:polysaccharide biosynthesis protein [Tessaracoccus sp. Y1736]